MRILILGGTAEARQTAERLAAAPELHVTLSLAGRTENPVRQPVPVRIGGFGGAEGLARHLAEQRIELLIDATHPYAARISANAAEAAKRAGVPILALRRPGWRHGEGDRWTWADDVTDAVRALGAAPRRVFLSIGRQEVGVFAAAPQHFYLIRSVDPVEPPLAVPNAHYLLARGPFAVEAEHELLALHGVDAIVSKDSGGSASYGKIAAARTLGIEVIMIRRPELPQAPSTSTVGELVAKACAHFGLVAARGV
ncbi:cobalt-precorrin-6A reductase [Aquamicrobium ahrensii]|uniref:Precorrin-6A/cobalt-precorrin-6A reductase n=1 Tax=Aquamicrobium ahrensii TaxID=469551 RepID=A0ABV2KI29_9HYPH